MVSSDFESESSSFNFSSDEEARESMKSFIKENFSELLGEKIKYLDEPNGFTKIQEAFSKEIEGAGKNVQKNIRELMTILESLTEDSD